jgi:hypothetical protein
LWDLRLSNQDISDYAESVIYGHINLMGWTLNVETELLQGTQNDIILIKIQLSKYEEVFEKIYKIE